MKGSQSKYHLRIEGKRTTTTVDTILSRLYAIKKGINPFENGGHTEVRDLLQDLADRNKIKKSDGVSQTLRYFMIMSIAPAKLVSEWSDLSQAELAI